MIYKHVNPEQFLEKLIASSNPRVYEDFMEDVVAMLTRDEGMNEVYICSLAGSSMEEATEFNEKLSAVLKDINEKAVQARITRKGMKTEGLE